MANTRDYNIAAIWAAAASTIIPPAPVTGVSYRNAALTPATVQAGAPFNVVASSADFNQVFQQAFSVLFELDRNGILGWTNLTNYTAVAIARGSDGAFYQATVASGPDEGGAIDPVGDLSGTWIPWPSVPTALSPGDIIFSAVNSWDTAAFFEADGALASRTTDAGIFARYGVAFGLGDGSTTFALPDYRGEFLRMWDHGAGRDPDRLARTDRGDGTLGDQPGTRQLSQVISHNHANGAFNQLLNSSGGTGGISEGFGGGTGKALIATVGGSETRGRNVYVVPIIKR
jgi:hypothetical protein